MKDTCKWCKWPPDAVFGCRARSDGDGGYHCSRHAGHDGPHVACAGEYGHAIHIWTGEEGQGRSYSPGLLRQVADALESENPPDLAELARDLRHLADELEELNAT